MDIDELMRVDAPEPKAWSRALHGQYLQALAGEDPAELAFAVREYAAAFRLADPEKDLFYDLVRALCEVIPLAACPPDDLASILHVLVAHFNDSLPGRPVSDPSNLKMNWRRWLRALLLLRFGAGRRAKILFELTRRDFEAASALPEYLTVTLDLGEMYHYQPDSAKKLLLLTAEASYGHRSLEHPDVRGALLIWRDTVLHGDLTDELIAHVRGRIGRWLRDDLAKRAADPNYRGPAFVKADQ